MSPPAKSGGPSTASSSIIVPTITASTQPRVHRPRRCTDEISLTQAVHDYCNSVSDHDTEGSQQEDADEAASGDNAVSPSPGGDNDGAHGVPQPPPQQAPRSLLFSGIYRGYVTLGSHGKYYAMGTRDGQNYFDLGYDPQEDSSWFDDMIRPIEEADVPPYYPMQGSNWGLTR